jgi:hypothetical protein
MAFRQDSMVAQGSPASKEVCKLYTLLPWIAPINGCRIMANWTKYNKRSNSHIFQPGPPMHPIFGHLIALGDVTAKLPARIHPHTLPSYLMKEHNLPSMFFIDARPIATLNLMIADP